MLREPPHLSPLVVRWFVLLAFAAIGLIYLYAYYDRAHTPLQPVAFSHATHTQSDKAAMDCLACHGGASHASGAGLPSSSTCLDCHRHILAEDVRLLPLHAAANPEHPAHTGEALRWVRKAPLPQGIAFHHGQHMKAGHSCVECHPDSDRQSPHNMRNCLDCHRRRQVPTNCDRCHH